MTLNELNESFEIKIIKIRQQLIRIILMLLSFFLFML